MITHAKVSEFLAQLETNLATYRGNIETFRAKIAEQESFILQTTGAITLANELLATSPDESAKVAGILGGLKRGMISLDEVAVIDNDLVVDIKERETPAESETPSAAESDGAQSAK